MLTRNDLEKEFEAEMFRTYERARVEAGYNATRFLGMLNEHGGVGTARILINSSQVSEGYAALWMKNRLDLAVEAVIHDNTKWHTLFSEHELKICSQRLRDYGYIK